MIETYRIFSRFTEKKNLRKTNEELVEMYKTAKDEYEKSQAVSSIYIKNIGMIMNIARRHSYMQQSEKASMILEELVGAVRDYTGEVKFLTYLSVRLRNIFLWEYSRTKKARIPFEEYISIEDSDEDSVPMQIADPQQENSLYTIEFFASVQRILRRELAKNNIETKENRLTRRKLLIAEKIIEILKEDSSLGASQIAAVLGLFKRDKSGNYIRTPTYRVQPCKTSLGEVKEGENRETQWYLVNDAKYLLRELFIENRLKEI